MNGEITSTLNDGIFQISISRPEKKNALTADMYSAMTSALLEGDNNADVRVMMICGSNGNFTAGNDLNDFLQNPPNQKSAPVFEFFNCLAHLKKPLVAAVEGFAVGIGTTLLLHCDLVYAASNTRFILPFVGLGLCPEAGSSYLLVQRVGYAKAVELILLGETLSAEQALEIGLITGISRESSVTEFALERCRKLASQPASAVRDSKALLKLPHQPYVRDSLSREIDVFINRLTSPETKEALAAFAEKRKPDFTKFK